jgi:hypothetical protein
VRAALSGLHLRKMAALQGKEMNIRKRMKHRARLSFAKKWGCFRKNGKLVMWNMRGQAK